LEGPANPIIESWDVSLVMLAFAMMAAIRHKANAVQLKKTLPRLPKKRRS
jgi:SRSO17 transposase